MSSDAKKFGFFLVLLLLAILTAAWVINSFVLPVIVSVVARGGEIAAENQARVVKVQSSPWYAEDYGTVRIWTDPETRCQYLYSWRGHSVFFTERRLHDKQICGEAAK